MLKLLNKHMFKKRQWEPTDKNIVRRTKRRSSRYSNSVGKQTKKRKLSKAILSADETLASKSVDARPMLSKRRKTNLVYVYDDSQPHRLQRRYKGLYNPNNTCYFNSVIQCLLYCPLARETIENVAQLALSNDVMREIRILFNRMTNNDGLAYLSPSECFKAVMNTPQCKAVHMSLDDRQEDVHEFLLKLLEHFYEALTDVAEVFNLPNVFDIILCSTISCQQCSRSAVTNEYLWVLSLPFPLDYNEEAPYSVSHALHIYSLMDSYFKAEILHDHPCSQCGFVGRTEKKLNITNAPQLLVLHLSRFTSEFEKIDTFVEFTTELTSEYIKDGNGQQMRYRLTGMIRHTGPSIRSGHYISYLFIDGNWYEANDTDVTEVSWQTVRTLHGYMLFYERL